MINYPPYADTQDPNLVELLGVVRRRLLLVILFTLTGLLAGSLATSFLPRKYEAQALIALETSEQNFGSAGNTVQTLLPPVESIVLSQVEVLRSRELIEELADDLLQDQAGAKTNSKEMLVQTISDNLDIRAVGRSLVIDVRFSDSDPHMAAKIINRLVALYQEKQVSDKILLSDQTTAMLQKRMESLAEKLRDSARAVEEYRVREDLNDGSKAEITSQQISDISSQLMAAQAEQAAAEARKTQTQELRDKKIPLDNSDDVRQSRMIHILENDKNVLETKLAQLQSKYGPNHPKILAIRAELAELSMKQKTETQQAADQAGTELLAINAKIDILQKNLKILEEKKHRENHAAIGLRELQREAEANRSLYKIFLNRYKESKMLGDIHQPDTKLISAARVPSALSGPHPALIMMVSSFIGFIFSILVCLILDNMESFIRNASHIKALTGLETLASLPVVRKSRRKMKSYVLDHPYDPLAEELRSMIFRIIGAKNGIPKLIALTSSLEEEGKTMTVLWMAQLFAKSGLKTLLIDANLRNPGFSNPGSGLSVAAGILDHHIIPNLIQPDNNLSFLSILTGKAADQQQVVSISQKDVTGFINNLKNDFDVIVIDCASYLNVSETQFFTKIADLCLMVVRWDYVAFDIFKSAHRRMVIDQVNVAGCILTHNCFS